MKIKSTFAFLLASSMGALFFAQTTEVSTQRVDSLRNILGEKISQIKSVKKSKSNGEVPPNEYFIQDYKRTLNLETGRTEPEKLYQIKKELDRGLYKTTQPLKMLSSGNSETGRSINNAPWVERGPYKVGGRTRAIMYDPNDTTGKRVFAGGVSGGLWVNDDITSETSEWTPIDDFMANTSISCIVSDPNDSQTFYVGTGESPTRDAIGAGIFKSTDGGSTWTQLMIPSAAYSNSGQVRNGIFYVNDIEVRNNNGTSEVYVGVSGRYTDGTYNGVFDSGLYKSTDGGENFENLNSLQIPGSSVHYSIQQVEIGADNSVWVSTRTSVVSGADSGGKIFRSTDGVTFTEVYDAGDSGSRVQIALSKTNPAKAYALLQITNSSTEEVRIIKTTNTGSTWSSTTAGTLALPDDADTGIPSNDFTRGQALYDLVIETAPNNDNEVYVGGIDLFKSTNGATSWTQISKWSNNNDLEDLNVSYAHADQHAIIFNPRNANEMLFGNDGGVFYASNKSNFASSTAVGMRNNRYNVTQFYDAKMNPNSTETNELMLAGAQDNGTQLFQGAPTQGTLFDTSEFTGGDGGMVEFDDQNAYLISSYIRNYHYIYNLTTDNLNYLISSTNRNKGGFINEIALDRNQDVFYSNGYDGNNAPDVISVVRVAGLGGTLSEDTVTINASRDSGEGISYMKVSPYNTSSSTLYIGTTIGKLYKVTNANTTPVVTTITTPISGNISYISFGATENDMILTVSNYGENTVKVYDTADGGTTWRSRQGNLPDMPVRASFMNPEDSDEVILGTELGIWQTSNFSSASPTWTQSPGAIGNVRVTAFDYRPSDKKILAATYGRGVYTTNNDNLATDEVGVNTELFQVYPNPSRGTFRLKLTSKYKNADVTIFDASGKLVFQKEDVTSNDDLNTNLTTGVYVLVAKNNGDQIFTSKVIIK